MHCQNKNTKRRGLTFLLTGPGIQEEENPKKKEEPERKLKKKRWKENKNWEEE